MTAAPSPPASPASVRAALLAFGATIDPAELFPVVVPAAAAFALSDPFAFTVATCLDRQTPAEIIWTVPHDLRAALGHLDPARIAAMTEPDLEEVFAKLPRKPRFVNDAPRTVREVATLVVREMGGDASRIWRDRTAAEVQRTFDRIHGVGPALASMAVLLIERAFGVRFPDREQMDIKPDVHTVRVLYRLGSSGSPTVGSALAAARALSPEHPGELDAPLWLVGRTWCRATGPRCGECAVRPVCARRDVLTEIATTECRE